MAENLVTITLVDYNNLRDDNRELEEKNVQLQNALNELQEADGQKVIIRETCTCFDGDEDYSCEEVQVKGFDEVKKEVEDFYKKKIDNLEKKVEKMEEVNKDLIDENLALTKENNRLNNRNVWQRICNN